MSLMPNQVWFFSKNPNSKRQVACLTKVATGVVALKWLDENEVSWDVEIAVSSEAVSGSVNPPGDENRRSAQSPGSTVCHDDGFGQYLRLCGGGVDWWQNAGWNFGS